MASACQKRSFGACFQIASRPNIATHSARAISRRQPQPSFTGLLRHRARDEQRRVGGVVFLPSKRQRTPVHLRRRAEREPLPVPRGPSSVRRGPAPRQWSRRRGGGVGGGGHL